MTCLAVLEEEKEKVKGSIEQIKAEVELTIADQKNEFEEISQKVNGEIKKHREELENLELLSFLSEPRFRDLKSRWGNQVFRADMGAEAFHDILSRVDLDKLSEELKKEVITTKSKQKRKINGKGKQS